MFWRYFINSSASLEEEKGRKVPSKHQFKLSRTFFFQSECKLIANHVLYTVMRTMLVAMIKKQQNVCVSVKLLRRNSHSRRTVLALKRRTAGKGGKWRENHAVTTWLDQCLRSSRNRGRGRGSGKKWEKKRRNPTPSPSPITPATYNWLETIARLYFWGGRGGGQLSQSRFFNPADCDSCHSLARYFFASFPKICRIFLCVFISITLRVATLGDTFDIWRM